MASITLRLEKGAPLSNQEIDDNFTNLNNSKAELSALGTAATRNTGTSGSNVPLLSTSNTWSQMQNFSNANVIDTLFLDDGLSAIYSNSINNYINVSVDSAMVVRRAGFASSWLYRHSTGKWIFRVSSQAFNPGDTPTWHNLLEFNSDVFTYRGFTIWHSGNDGAGSGLDAGLWSGSNKFVSTADPSGGNDGDIWFKYS